MWRPFWNWILDPANQVLLLCIAFTFIIGLIIGLWARRSSDKRDKNLDKKGEEAFFKGVQYILSNDHDQAIEEFTKSVQINSETIETYVALGNLFRSKGEIDRAIRIRQNIILRPNIDEKIKLRALLDLGLDYRKGGFLNRALRTFNKVTQKVPSDVATLKEIVSIYEELKDWGGAFKALQKIARLTKNNYDNILAHYLVEDGKAHYQDGDLDKAISLFNRAISTHKGCVDAYLHLGDLYFSRREYKKAISSWKRVSEVSPQLTFLAFRRLERAYSEMKNLKPIETFLKECSQSNADAFTHMALARYLYNEGDLDASLREIENALALDSSFWEARKFKGEILLKHGRDKEALNEYRELIKHLNVPYLKFQCRQCGFEPKDLQWKCSQCKQWDTIGLVDSVAS